jgi:hypothetical protein
VVEVGITNPPALVISAVPLAGRVHSIDDRPKRVAEGAIRPVQTDLRKQGYELTCFGLPLGSTKPLPGLDKILRSHALIHTADGELFRQALIHASGRCHIAAFTIKERDLLAVACKSLNIKKEDLLGRLTALGKLVGSPWSQDEKFAALAAWLALFSLKAKAGSSSTEVKTQEG